MKNKQVILTAKGDYTKYLVQTTEIEAPKKGEVQIKILASGFAWADVMMRFGMYPAMPKFPFVQGYDIVGEIIKVGEGVSENYKGKRVAAFLQWGGHSQYINLPTEKLIEISSSLDPYQVECLPLNYITAYQVLTRAAKVKKNDTILVHGAAGGVGTAILQLAKVMGIKVYGTASTAKQNTIRENGGYAIDYKTEDFEKIIKEKEPNGIDAVFDIGGKGTYNKSGPLLKKKGAHILYGLIDTGNKMAFLVHIIKLNFKNIFTSKTGKFYSVKGLYDKSFDEYKSDFLQLVKLLENKEINPIVAKVISLDEVSVTHKEFEAHQFIGKVIVDPWK